MARYKSTSVSAKKYTVKGVKVPKVKTPKVSGTTFKGLKSGKTTTKTTNPLKMKAHL